MSTKNIECQLAQGQIGRYLNGERFSGESIKQLEAHVADCDECSELVSRRRQALLAMLGERNKNIAVVSTAAMPETKPQPVEETVHALKTKAAEPTPTATPTPTKTQMFAQVMSSKPLLYTSALAVVLLAMSYLSHGALKTFGPTADTVVAADKPAKPIVAPIQPPVSTPATTAVSHPASTAVTTPAPKPTTVHPAAIVDNTKAPDNTKVADNSDSAPDTSTDTDDNSDTSDTPPTPVVTAPVKHVAAHRVAHRARPRRIVRAARRAPTYRVARRAVRIRARQISSHQRVAMVTRHRPARVHHVSSALTNGVRIYDPSGRPLQ